jgi:hypothetical protein
MWIWGVIWTREDVQPDDEVTWYDSKEEAVDEYNGRGDKYWRCPLVRATVNPPVVMAEMIVSPFEAGYDNFYYRPESS